MFLSHLYDGLNVIVVERVVYRLSLAAALYELARLKSLELVRYGRLVHLNVFTYLTDCFQMFCHTPVSAFILTAAQCRIYA